MKQGECSQVAQVIPNDPPSAKGPPLHPAWNPEAFETSLGPVHSSYRKSCPKEVAEVVIKLHMEIITTWGFIIKAE